METETLLDPNLAINSTRCGFVTLIGRPNVGKSTLLNAMLGEKIAITSAKPQTTRNRIPGILTIESRQIVFIDTPGLHHAHGALNKYMVDVAKEALWDTDVVALLVEAGIGSDGQVGVSPIIEELLGQLAKLETKVILVLNKIDRMERELLLPIIDAWRERFDFVGIVPLSALKNEGVPQFVEMLADLIPEGPHLYPPDSLTDLPERFLAAEIVREQLFRELEQELPYSVAVTIEDWRDRSSQGRIDIDALVIVERDSQKGIVIGKGGQMIKKIGTVARKSIERLLGTPVNLKLFVRVEKGWTRSEKRLQKLGYKS
jgi:GTP-binding protein Era